MNEDLITNESAVPEAGRPNSESGSQSQSYRIDLTPDEQIAIDLAKDDPNQTAFKGVDQLNKLKPYEVIFLILNRCIGLFFEVLFRIQINNGQVLECSCRHPLSLRTQKALGSQ
jgi:hypothetical protein